MLSSFWKNVVIFFKCYYPAILAGAFYGVGNNFAEFFWPAAILSIFLLLVFIVTLKSNESAFLAGILFEFVFLAVSFSWVLKSFPLEWMGITNHIFAGLFIFFIWMIVPLYMSLPFGLFALFTRRVLTSKIHFFIKVFSIASFWVIAEIVRAGMYTIFFLGDQSLLYPHTTYHSLAYTLVWSDFFSILLPWGGMYAISFVSIFLIVFVSLRKNNKKAAVVFLLILATFQFLASYKKTEYIDTAKVSLFTTQFESVSLKMIHKVNRYEDSKEIFNKEITQNLEIQTSDMIMFPENTYFIAQSPYVRDPNLVGFEKSLFLDSARYQGEYLLTYMKNNTKEYYKKQMLLPQGEYSSYWVKYFAMIFNQKKWIASFEAERYTIPGSASSIYEAGYFDTTKSGLIKIGGILCYEIISPVFFRKQTEAGANILAVLASHAIFPNSKSLLNQTISIAKVRAIENNRFVVQSTNKNSSFIVSNEGEIVFISDPNKVSSYTADVPLIENKTFYTKHGDLIVIFSFIFPMLVFGYLFLRRKHLL